MTETKDWLQKTFSDIAIISDIDIKETVSPIASVEDLQAKLTEIISYLIDHNFEKLLYILYRIDVDEEKAKNLLSKNSPEDPPSVLADLIIQRQMKKEEVKKQFENASAFTDPNEDDDLKL
jgi:hypothetical protein